MHAHIQLATGYEELLHHSILSSKNLKLHNVPNTTKCCASGTLDFNMASYIEF